MTIDPGNLISNMPEIPLWIRVVLGFSTAFLITWVAIPSIVRTACRKDLFAYPNGRTSHFGHVPNLGGIGVFAGLILASLLFTGLDAVFELKYVLAGLLVLFFVGVKDDMVVISPRNKLIGQLAAVLLVVIMGGIRISSFHGLFGINEIPYIISVLFSILVFLAIINGFNLIDGIDGLSSGVAMLVSLVFGIWFFVFGMDTYGIMSFSFIGALVAFFWYNVYGRKNRIFLGDTGSMIIGFMVAVFAINYMEHGIQYPESFGAHTSPAIAFSILILPLFDTIRVFALRIKSGTSPFNADRRHLHHMLLELGLNHIQATSLLIGVNVFFILMAFSLQQMGNLFLIALTLALATSLSSLLWILQNRKKKNSFEYKYKILREEMFTNIYSLNNRGNQVLTKVS